MMSKKAFFMDFLSMNNRFLILVIIAACFLSYFNTLSAGFVWDDNSFIVANPYMHSFKYLGQYFTHDFWNIGIQTLNSGYYRPLLAASFMLDHFFWGLNPFGYHLTNLVLHVLVSIMLFLFLEALVRDRRVAFFAALLFSAHPLHTESVSFVSGRVDLLPLFFMLLSLVLFLKYVSRKRSSLYLFSLFCFFAALLTKEMAVTLPLIILVMDYLFISQRSIKRVFAHIWPYHLGFFVVLGAYLLMRFYFIGWSFVIGNMRYVSNFLSGTSHYWRYFTVLQIITLYLRLLFFPYALKVDYFFSAANSLFTPVVLLGLAIVSFLVLAAKKCAKEYPLVTFSVAWFFITFLPVSNLVPLGNIFAERYMYIPSVGFCIGIAFVFLWLLQKNIQLQALNWQQMVTLIFFLLVIAFGRVTFERNKVWNNEYILWYETSHASPNSPRAHINLASAYYSLNFLDEAIKEARAALQLYPAYYEALNLLGQIYVRKDLNDEAIKVYKKAISMFPERASAYNSLSVAYGKKSQYKEAIEACLTALKLNPYYDEARYNLALSYGLTGQIEEAIMAYEQYLQTNPANPAAHVALGHLYYKKNHFEKARYYWLAALEMANEYQPAKKALELLAR